MDNTDFRFRKLRGAMVHTDAPGRTAGNNSCRTDKDHKRGYELLVKSSEEYADIMIVTN